MKPCPCRVPCRVMHATATPRHTNRSSKKKDQKKIEARDGAQSINSFYPTRERASSFLQREGLTMTSLGRPLDACLVKSSRPRWCSRDFFFGFGPSVVVCDNGIGAIWVSYRFCTLFHIHTALRTLPPVDAVKQE